MQFNSFEFIVFLPIVVLLYNLCSERYRVYVLLIASFAFYAYLHPLYLCINLIICIMTYSCARWIAVCQSDKGQKRIMFGGIFLVLMPLASYKFFPFHHWILPVGLSFYTFMAISYIVDVYQGKIQAEKNPCKISLFLSFFPYVLSGPIERADHILPQMDYLRKSTPSDLTNGAKLMLWGYFMKLCVGDRLAIYTDAIFNNFEFHSGASLLFALVLVPIQCYADFGGYSFIATGVARCFGINIMNNFNRPLFSTSISDFWHRWHISLMKWFNDYIYTPIFFSLRNRNGYGFAIAILTTFIISGLWHGVSLTIVIWGMMNGVIMIFERHAFRNLYFSRQNLSWAKFLRILLTYSVVVFCMLFTRFSAMADVGFVVKTVFSNWGQLFIDADTMVYGLFSLVVLFAVDFFEEFLPGKIKLANSSKFIFRWGTYLFLIISIMLFGVLDGGSFIYFQF